MKKYVWLAVGTAVALAAALLLRQGLSPKTESVELVTVESSSVRQTVECTGKVASADVAEVFVDVPCIAQTVFVSEGQYVEAGDVLFTVDKEATQQVLAQLGGAVSGSAPTQVTAPVSGVVSGLSVSEGQVASNLEPCAVISSGNTVHIAVVVRERYVSRIALGQEVEISGVAFAKERYHGTVTHIASSAHQEYIGTSSETVVDAVVTLREEELDDSLRAGLNARARVLVNVIEEALLVPYTCIAQDDEGNEYIYVYNEKDNTVSRVVPEFGEECEEGVLVVSGLASGARIVQEPERLSGERLAVQVE